MGVHTLVNAAVASWVGSSRSRRSVPPDSDLLVGIRTEDDESSRRPLLTMTLPSQQSFGPASPVQAYGATSGGSSSARSSPEMNRRNGWLGRVPEEGGLVEEDDEEDSEEVEWDLEERGFYGGSYKRTVALYCIVPITSLLTFILFAILPLLIWPTDYRAPSSYPRYFPSPLPELLVSGSLWSLSHLIRVPLYSLTTSLLPWPITGTVLFHVIYVFLNQLLHLSALPILRIRHQMIFPLPTFQDPAFHRVWWISLGWAAVEVAVGIAQGYEQIAMYKEVMVPEDEVRALLTDWRNGNTGGESVTQHQVESPEEILPLSPCPGQVQDSAGAAVDNVRDGVNGRKKRTNQLEDAIRSVIDNDMEQLVHLKEREELEELYGIPVVRIPVFISCLLRIDSFVLSLGLTLILAASYLRSSLSFPKEPLPPIYTNNAFFVTFPVVVLIYLFLALIHTPPVLPRIGVHSTAYIGLLLGLGSVFAGLGLWGALS
ncbi:hypothetical protein SCP_1002050 [Sparassis crispa]|uniref:Uncharacterized protein n=1 Tax=Sparassis crispa TaxID=139825 RepID=A0A401GXQ3_9APHY|nr:hypothetical protein SCP_1002050 [Sparassis crispa]GBE86960.1 hypothetical protein SCP_1002050 [Sparassis crispa]